jgi:hypothetical protein
MFLSIRKIRETCKPSWTWEWEANTTQLPFSSEQHRLGGLSQQVNLYPHLYSEPVNQTGDLGTRDADKWW